MANKNKTSAKRIRILERQRHALEIRRTGASLQVVADTCGFSNAGGAFNCITRALDNLIREPGETVRKLELSRLDVLLSAVWLQALEGDGPSVDRALKIMERRARLLGLDAPVSLTAETFGRGVNFHIVVDTPPNGTERTSSPLPGVDTKRLTDDGQHNGQHSADNDGQY